MRIYLERPSSAWARDSGYLKHWDQFVSNLTDHPGRAIRWDDAASADVIIQASNQQLDTLPVRAYFRPLSDRDVKLLVWDWGDRPTGRHSGFYCSPDPWIFDHSRHRTMHYPVPFNDLVRDMPLEDATYDFGFLGGISHPLRARLVRLLAENAARWPNCFIKAQGMDWSNIFKTDHSDIRTEYAEFLRRTRFILCPRGYGTGSARLFETLKAGRVPVIISDRYALPDGIDWSRCALRVPEHRLGDIKQVVEANLHRWEDMARHARLVWEEKFSDEHCLTYIAEQVAGIRATLPRATLAKKFGYMRAMGVRLAEERARPALARLKGAISPAKTR